MAKIDTTVGKLVDMIRDGDLRLPEMQRRYVWPATRVRDLLDSLYRGYPSGTILVWETDREMPSRDLDIGQLKGAFGGHRLLLDGQQRLTSLFTLFEGGPPPFYEGEDLFFNLYFNVVTEEFRFWNKSVMEGDPSWISVHGFLKEGIQSFVKSLPTIEEEARDVYTDHLDRLARLDDIRNFRYQLDMLSDESLAVEDVVDIFNRVNSAGTPLTKADLAIAHVCSVWPEARDEFRAFSKQMDGYGFGVDLNFLVRSVAAMAAGSVLLEGSFYRVPPEELQLAWKKSKQAFEHLVNVLRHEAFVDGIKDLATAYALMPPTVFLAANGGAFTDELVRKQFIRWIYLASIWARYTGTTETKLQRDVAIALSNDDPVGALVDQIVDERGRIAIDAKDLEGKGSASSAYKFSYVVARANGAKDWFTGQVLYNEAIGASNGLESHHVFPLAYLKKLGYGGSEHQRLRNEVANRVFLTQKANREISASAPSEYLPDVDPKALQDQSVTMNRDLWKGENFELFVAERRKLLAKVMNEYLDSLVPPELKSEGRSEELVEYLKQEESQHLEFKGSMRYDQRQKQVNKELEKVIAKSIAGLLNSKDGGVLLKYSLQRND